MKHYLLPVPPEGFPMPPKFLAETFETAVRFWDLPDDVRLSRSRAFLAEQGVYAEQAATNAVAQMNMVYIWIASGMKVIFPDPAILAAWRFFHALCRKAIA